MTKKYIQKEKQLTSINEALFLSEKWIQKLATNIQKNIDEMQYNALTIWIVWSWWSWKSSFLNILLEKFWEKKNIENLRTELKYYIEKSDTKIEDTDLVTSIKSFIDNIKNQKQDKQKWKKEIDNKLKEISKNDENEWNNWLYDIIKLRKIHVIEEYIKENNKNIKITKEYYIIWVNSWLLSNIKINPMIALLNYISFKLNLNIFSLLENVLSLWLWIKKALDGETDKIKNISAWIWSITQLKTRFEKLLEQYLWENTKILLVIDDLDRISPQEAIMLLDGIKLFLDNKYMWIFLLNDKDIVRRWLKEKLWLETDKEVEQIATSYLDKLINIEIDIEKYYSKYIFQNEILDFIENHDFVKSLTNNNPQKFVELIKNDNLSINWKEISIVDALYKLKNMRVIKKLFKNFEIQWPALLYSNIQEELKWDQKINAYFEIFKNMLKEYIEDKEISKNQN